MKKSIKEIQRIYTRDSQKESLSRHHPENLQRLLAAFRSGKNGRPLQTRRNISPTAALEFAHIAGRALFEKGSNFEKNSLTAWRNARFCQGKMARPLFVKV